MIRLCTQPNRVIKTIDLDDVCLRCLSAMAVYIYLTLPSYIYIIYNTYTYNVHNIHILCLSVNTLYTRYIPLSYIRVKYNNIVHTACARAALRTNTHRVTTVNHIYLTPPPTGRDKSNRPRWIIRTCLHHVILCVHRVRTHNNIVQYNIIL